MSERPRQLAAILFTDIVGYTAMMQKDEAAALSIIQKHHDTMQNAVARFHGEIHNYYGDGCLCLFPSATEATRCALDVQQRFREIPSVPVRIGIHLGEIFFDGGKVLGDAVNIASRIQSLGLSNSILVSGEVADKFKNQPGLNFVSLGNFNFKNVDKGMEVFALAGEGLTVPKKEQLAGKLKEKKTRKWFWLVSILVALLLPIAIIINNQNSNSGDATAEPKSIAVLPFENVGIDNTEDYISDGITQDIINNLSKISSLQKVIGWFSVKNLKKTTKSVKEIADQLGVAAILSGTIEKQGGKTHVIAELTEVNSNKRLWGDEFDYDSKDVVSIHSRVAGEIVTALKANLTPDEKKTLSKHYTENVEAYKYYIRGRTFWNARGKANFDSAEAYFKKAIALDKDYALAYSGIADCYLYNFKGLPQLEAVPIARAYANQALALDSNLSEGLTSLGFIQHNFDYDWTKSRKTLEKAIALDPNNATAHLYLGNVLEYTGEIEAGLAETRKAVELEPLSFSTNWVLGRNYYFAGRTEESLAQLKKTQAIAPKSDVVFWSLALVYLTKKMNQEALTEYTRITDSSASLVDNIYFMKAYAYAITGNKAEAMVLIQKGLKEPNPSPYRLAQAYIALGDNDKALDLLEQGYSIRDLHMFWIKIDPAFSTIRENPRFKAILVKMNYP